MPQAQRPIIEEIVDQHFEEACFLWQQRDAAADSPIHSLQDLVHLDERVEAHIDGLRVAGDRGWSICAEGFDEDEPGTVFTATVLAFESGDPVKTNMVIEAANKSREQFRALISGLGWMNDRRFKASIRGLVSHKSRYYRRAGYAACEIRRLNPRIYLDQAVLSADLFLRARVLKAIGKIKRVDLLPQVQDNLQHGNDECRFEAARAALLLGDRSAVEVLHEFVLSNHPFKLAALQMALRILDVQTSQNWLKDMAANPGQRRDVLFGTGIVGDPLYVPTLLKHMDIPEMARTAGAAFSMITGVDLVEAGLENDAPDDFEDGPTDDPEDENVDTDADEDLPWPNAELIANWWSEHGSGFAKGTRYMSGKPISLENCLQVMKNGMQSQRNAAALELALSIPDATYFNTKARGSWQLRNL